METWIQAENSFNNRFADFSTTPWGNFAHCSERKISKFNFVRLLDENLTHDGFQLICKEYRAFFGTKDIPLWFKVPQSVKLSDQIMNSLEHKGTPIVYMEMTYQKSPIANSDIDLIQCSSDEEFFKWFSVNQRSSSRDKKYDAIMENGFRKAFNDNAKLFYLEHDNNVVSACAFDDFSGETNLWGIVTLKDYRARGLWTDLQNLANAKIGKSRFHTQANLNGETYKYFMKMDDVVIHEIEDRYILK